MLFSRTNKNKCTNAAIIAFKGKRNKSAGVCEAAKIFNLRDNESNQDFGYWAQMLMKLPNCSVKLADFRSW